VRVEFLRTEIPSTVYWVEGASQPANALALESAGVAIEAGSIVKATRGNKIYLVAKDPAGNLGRRRMKRRR
jgi:hypothetical protein